jgi:hypothetical protein
MINNLFKRVVRRLLCLRTPPNCFRCRRCGAVDSVLANCRLVGRDGKIREGLCRDCFLTVRKWNKKEAAKWRVELFSSLDSLLLLLLLCAASCFGYTVDLGWQASPDPKVTSYHIYAGSSPGARERMIDAGNHTVGQVDGLENMRVVYFVVRAFSAESGLESADSNEIGIPVWPAIAIQPAGIPLPATIFSQVEINKVFVVEYCDDLARGEWRELSRQMGAGAPIFIGDRTATGVDKRFYRGMLIP